MLFCGSKQVKKNGTRGGKQRYKCTACNKRFSGGSRLDPDTLWQLYSDGKQTAAQLAVPAARCGPVLPILVWGYMANVLNYSYIY